ncbi:MAG: hypothetical protein ISS82_04975 [Nanoarchaeota archaeon]|nr:hypothetical protein [Nanoarchaeota archaeon]
MNLTPKEKAVLNLINEDVAYENYFFQKVSDLKWFYPLKELGYFNPEKAPCLKPSKKEGYFTIPEWNVLPYLERLSQREDINNEYIDELLSIIVNTTNYHIENNNSLDNYRTWWYFIKILYNIPNEKNNDEIIELISIWLESRFDTALVGSEILDKFIPKFLDSSNREDVQKAERIINLITKIKWDDKYKGKQKEVLIKERSSILGKPENERTKDEKLKISFFNPEEKEPYFVIDKFYIFDSFLKKGIAKKVGEKCSIDIVFILADKLKDIIKEQFNTKEDLSYIWLNSFFHKTESILDIKELIALIITEIILGKVESKNQKEVNIIFEKFLSNEYKYSIFKRIILFIIGKNWVEYRGKFWKLIDSDTNCLYFNNQYFEPEIYGILEKNIEKFSKEEKEKLKKIIEEKVPDKPHPKIRYRDFYEAYKKQRWYSAVKSDPIFAELYKKQKYITKEEEEIEFKEPTVRWGPGPPPLNKEEILKMPNELLAKYLKDFRTVDHWKGPTIGGLADLLKITVEENPDKFTDNLLPFIDSGFLYVYEIIWGLEDAWKNGKLINWEKILSFISEYISDKNFWDDNYIIKGDDWNADHLWIIGVFGNLIKTGVKDNSRPFPEKSFIVIKKLIFKLLDKIFIEEKEEIHKSKSIDRDFINDALNSSLGKLIEGLILLAFRINNYETKTGKVIDKNWKEEVIEKYNEILKNNILEGYVWLGFYIPDFYYFLDKPWVKSKIQEINEINENNDIRWLAFIEGFLFSGRVYKELYKLMKTNYLKAIEMEFENEYITNHLVQHICVEYLNKDLDITDKKGLIIKILDKWNKMQIEAIISYFWMLMDLVVNKKEQAVNVEESIRKKNKIIAFWKWVYENKFKGKNDNNLSSEDKEIISNLSKLTIFLPEINAYNFEWLLLSATYIHTGFNSPSFIEYLNFLKDKKDSVKYIGKIFLRILEKYTPDYNRDHIRSIVAYLYEKKYGSEADEICNQYALRGSEFLIDIYKKYHKN